MKNRLNLRIRISFAIVVLAMATPVLAYVTGKTLSASGEIVALKWKSFPVTWRMNPTRGSNVTGAREQADVFRQSFQPWTALTTASISFTEGQTTDATVKPAFDGINVVTTNVTAAEYASLNVGQALGVTIRSFFDQGGANFVDSLNRPIEFAGQILEADIVFNPSVQFTTSSTAVTDRIDLQSVAAHEVGHFIGMEHTSLVSATMFPTVGQGFIYPRVLSADDIAGISTIYPAASFATKGTISGSVKTTANAAVYGAIVTAVNSSGQPAASAITNPSGQYTIAGLDAGAYTVYAEPMDGPLNFLNVTNPLQVIYPGQSVNSNFTTRFR